MAMIEGFRVQNYGVLKDITLGKLWNQHNVKPLTPLIALIGKNGVGVSVSCNGQERFFTDFCDNASTLFYRCPIAR